MVRRVWTSYTSTVPPGLTQTCPTAGPRNESSSKKYSRKTLMRPTGERMARSVVGSKADSGSVMAATSGQATWSSFSTWCSVAGATADRCCSAPATAASRRSAEPRTVRCGTVPGGGAVDGRASRASTRSNPAEAVMAFQSFASGMRLVRATNSMAAPCSARPVSESAQSSMACDIRSVGPSGLGLAASTARVGASLLMVSTAARRPLACSRAIHRRLRRDFQPSSGW